MDFIKRVVCFILCCSGSQSRKADLLEAKTAYAQFEASTDKKGTEAHSFLVTSITSYSRVAESYRQTNHRDLYVILVSLANAIWNLYENFGRAEKVLSDETKAHLQRVIDLYTKALQVLPKGDVGQIGVLYNNLANAYRERFIKMRQKSDIKSAAEFYQKASQCCVKISREGVELLMEIGRTYCMWHYHTSVLLTHAGNEITMAIEALNAAYVLCDDPRLVQDCADIKLTCAYILAAIYHDLFKAHEQSTPSQPSNYLSQAIYLYQFALENTSNEDERSRDAHQALSSLLFYRYEIQNNNQDLQEAQTIARTCVQRYTNLTPDYRKLLDVIINFDPKAPRRDSREQRDTLRSHTLGSFRNSMGSAIDHEIRLSQIITEEPDSIPSSMHYAQSYNDAESSVIYPPLLTSKPEGPQSHGQSQYSSGLLVPPLLYSRSSSSRKELVGISYSYSR